MFQVVDVTQFNAIHQVWLSGSSIYHWPQLKCFRWSMSHNLMQFTKFDFPGVIKLAWAFSSTGLYPFYHWLQLKCFRWSMSHNLMLFTKFDFPGVLKLAWNHVTEGTKGYTLAVKAFSSTGLYPFNPEAVDQTRFLNRNTEEVSFCHMYWQRV